MKKEFKIRSHHKKYLADLLSPVSIYLRLRDIFPFTKLLESSDYHGNENSYSYVCFDPVSQFKLQNDTIEITYPDKTFRNVDNLDPEILNQELQDYLSSFNGDSGHDEKFVSNGLFGYVAYDGVKYFEDITLKNKKGAVDIPDILYNVFRYIIVIDHFKNELYLFEHNYVDSQDDSRFDEVERIIHGYDIPKFNFSIDGNESSNLKDEKYIENVKEGIENCKKGEVFQIVLSRRFTTGFKGDDFNVYRALRSINPSPYLFYFDYGSFKIFGSSPESQLVIKNGEASIFPIAGTFKRTGSDSEDQKMAEELFNDEKENAEHVMLVDLARNDLSRNGENVNVEKYKEIQFYSHVIHLVSKVTAKLNGSTSSLKMIAETFPAGTLSGAPKYRAMQLIDQIENTARGAYGGAIGFLGFNGDFNHAIMIRTFLSKDNKLIYQAGAGVVSKSNPESELNEVNNKLGALRKAIQRAEEI